jgi:NAD+ diphosphatase
MLQDIFPKKFDNHYYNDAVPGNDSYIIHFRNSEAGKEILVKASGRDRELLFPVMSDFEEIIRESLIYLFRIDEKEYYLLFNPDSGMENKDGYCYKEVRSLRREGNPESHQVFALYTAFHLSEWYETSRFCGRCGCETSRDKIERAVVCPKCNNRIYPRINPAVIIGVTDKETNRIILTKYRTGFAQNALVAGFTEIGETLEETVMREVMEEVGLEVENVRYYKSQPWGVALDILSGFYCDVKGNKDIRMDESELKYAEWVAPEDIVLQTPDYSLTNEMMRLFKERGYEGTLKSGDDRV